MITQLKEKLEYLAAIDKDFKVFGSRAHKYQSVRLSEEDVINFETKLGMRLPLEYREFLTEIGYQAGPYYGLWSPDEGLLEYQDLSRGIEEEGEITISPTHNFPFTTKDTLAYFNKQKTGDDDAHTLSGVYPANGSIPICHQGCTYWACLVVKGEQTGKVWDAACFVGWDGEWTPARYPVATLEFKKVKSLSLAEKPVLSFYEWYDGWLEKSIYEVEQLNTKVVP